MIKALIITYYWPPSGGSGVQRWLKFVKYFRENQIEPVIFTIDNPHYQVIDTSLLDEIPDNLEIIRQAIWEPTSISSFLGYKSKESTGFLNPNPSFVGRLVQYIRANYFIPDARKFWVKPSVRRIVHYLKEQHIDVLITTGPPHSLHLIGQKVKKATGIKWISDFRDPWTEIDYFHQLPLTEGSKKKHIKMETDILKESDAVIVVSDEMLYTFSKLNNKVHMVYNGFDVELSDEPAKCDEKFSITHIGMMNADRNHPIFWEALRELCEESDAFKRDLVIRLVGKLDNSVIHSLQHNKLLTNAEIISYVSHNEAINFQKESQLLYLAINNVPSAKGIVTGKVFEYMAAMRPILAIGPEDGDLSKIFNRTAAGKIVGFKDKEKLKLVILEYYSKYKKGNLSVNSENIEHYSRRNLTKEVSSIIHSMLS